SLAFLPRRRLQADPTLAYGCKVHPHLPSCKGFDGKHITRAMLDDSENPYNTYKREGLPPTPICNPGRSALRAVLEHQKHDYFYFVASGERKHRFSKSLSEHKEGVAELRKREQQRPTP
ncbi:MAG: endolytic transglycosylase MltG, partial [Deltaproteobacteria bacterium]|nr:endolytic transglycosylase MltG [Deltaproteobacteria bacterium]